MKGGGGGVVLSSSSKRNRWSGLVIGVVFLVFLSMLVPLAFLFGIHNGFYSSSGYFASLRQTSSPNHINDRLVITNTNTNIHTLSNLANSKQQPQPDTSTHIADLVRKLGPSFPKDVIGNITSGANAEPISKSATQHTQKADAQAAPHLVFHPRPTSNNSTVPSPQITESTKSGSDVSRKLCELKYGSYCLWREEHREELKDSMVKRMKDLLFVARAYYPTITKLPTQSKLSREMRQNIQEFERVLSESSTDTDLPPKIEKKLQNMQTAIARAKKCPVDCNNVDKKLRQILDMTEDEANFHMRQSAFLYQVAIQTLPKSLHCLSMKLTVEYFKSSSFDKEESVSEKFSDRALHHYVIFSKNVLASSVVINSTVMHSKDSGTLIFHVLTDRENYFAMKQWFFKNTYKESTVQVLNIEDLNLQSYDKSTSLRLSLSLEYRLSSPSDIASHNRMQYISTFSHLHYMLPEVLQGLEKVVVLDDDVVVQRDLSALWSLNMEGKVVGAVEVCSLHLEQLKSYLGENNVKKNSCAWMSGLNIIDLNRWRELNLTETYRQFVRELQVGMGEESIDSVILHASLLTFQDLVYALDGDVWALSGLGYDYGLDIRTIKKAAVLHYNGNMKPWLELGIPKYKMYWKKYLNREDGFLSECNVSP